MIIILVTIVAFACSWTPNQTEGSTRQLQMPVGTVVEQSPSLTLVTPTLISSGPRATLTKQPGKSPSSFSSRSLPWCRVMWSSPVPWLPGCRDGSNSRVTSSCPTVKSWPKLLAMEEMELSESVEIERLSWAIPVGSSSLLISSR